MEPVTSFTPKPGTVHPIDLFFFCIQNSISLERMQVAVCIAFVTTSPSKPTQFWKETRFHSSFFVSLFTLELPSHTQQLASPSSLIKSEGIAETKSPQQFAQRVNQSSLSFHCYPRHCGTASTAPEPLLEVPHFIPLISSYTTGMKNRDISFINFYECYVSVYLCGLWE